MAWQNRRDKNLESGYSTKLSCRSETRARRGRGDLIERFESETTLKADEPRVLEPRNQRRERENVGVVLRWLLISS